MKDELVLIRDSYSSVSAICSVPKPGQGFHHKISLGVSFISTNLFSFFNKAYSRLISGQSGIACFIRTAWKSINNQPKPDLFFLYKQTIVIGEEGSSLKNSLFLITLNRSII